MRQWSMSIQTHENIRFPLVLANGEQANALRFWHRILLRFKLCFIILFRTYYVWTDESLAHMEPPDIFMTKWTLEIYGRAHIHLFPNRQSLTKRNKLPSKSEKIFGMLES